MATAVAAGCGAAYGLTLARFLFERSPQSVGLLDTWPGALGLASVTLVVAAILSLVTRGFEKTLPNAAWAPLALALSLFGLLARDVDLLRSITLLLGSVALFAVLLTAPSSSWPHSPLGPAANRFPGTLTRLYPLFLFICLVLLYLRTLAPAVGQADTFEFQVDVAQLGVAHGSGYPLLMLVGRLFTWLPVGGPLAYRANLSSAFFAALAAVGVERLARKLGASPVVGLLAGLAFGVSPTLWSRAVEIEVFALNAAFVAAILYLCFDLILPPQAASGNQSPHPKLLPRLMLLAFVFGLSLTNHLTSLFLGPACLLAAAVALWRQHLQQPRSAFTSWAKGLALVVLALLIGLSVYLYLPLRWPAVNHGEPLSLAGFANILTGNEARGAFNWRLPFQDPGRYAIVWGKLAGEYGWPGLALAALGIVALILPLRGRRAADQTPDPDKPLARPLAHNSFPTAGHLVFLILLATSLGYLYFGLAFNVPDPSFSSYIIPLHLITAVLMGLGIQWLVNGLAGLSGQGSAAGPDTRPLISSLLRPAYCLLLSAFCLLPLTSIWRTFSLVDHSNNWAAERFGDLMLSQPLTRGAAILADSEKIAPLDYLQIAEGRRPDLDIIVLPDEGSYRAALDERLAAGQVVYLGRYLPGLGGAYSLRSVGPLAEVSTTPFTTTTMAVVPAASQPSAEGLTLLGYAKNNGSADMQTVSSGELDLTLLWQARAVPAESLLVNLRLVDAGGQPAWRSVGSVPVSGLYPTNAWRAGEIISDFYRLATSSSLAPGRYQLQVALAPPFSPISDSAWTSIAPVTILPSSQAVTPPHLLRDRLDNNLLLGYDIPDAVAPGSRVAITLYWLRTAETTTVAALGETHSLAAWPDGSTVPIIYHLTAPAGGDRINLQVAADHSARCGWLAPTTAACPLPAIHLAGQAAAEGAVNFDNQILLNHARLQTPRVAPGDRVTVDLEWQALRAIDADYTVFVHLIGPDGLVHGQVDLWPVSGTRATSGWMPGERIADPYNVPLPGDAPLGAYHVEIGLYLLATGERLPVLNADGAPVDDRLLLDGPQVVAP